ncbi:hypothetical protein NC651_002396 [Populus alba x Populus x berolinensis]|nr:hypothetical protein NC651_002396 [Populus alba x Populus x berolinensis]
MPIMLIHSRWTRTPSLKDTVMVPVKKMRSTNMIMERLMPATMTTTMICILK